MKSLVRQLNLYGFSKVQQSFQRSASLADFLAEEKEVSVLSKVVLNLVTTYSRSYISVCVCVGQSSRGGLCGHMICMF